MSWPKYQQQKQQQLMRSASTTCNSPPHLPKYYSDVTTSTSSPGSTVRQVRLSTGSSKPPTHNIVKQMQGRPRMVMAIPRQQSTPQQRSSVGAVGAHHHHHHHQQQQGQLQLRQRSASAPVETKTDPLQAASHRTSTCAVVVDEVTGLQSTRSTLRTTRKSLQVIRPKHLMDASTQAMFRDLSFVHHRDDRRFSTNHRSSSSHDSNEGRFARLNAFGGRNSVLSVTTMDDSQQRRSSLFLPPHVARATA